MHYRFFSVSIIIIFLLLKKKQLDQSFLFETCCAALIELFLLLNYIYRLVKQKYFHSTVSKLYWQIITMGFSSDIITNFNTNLENVISYNPKEKSRTYKVKKLIASTIIIYIIKFCLHIYSTNSNLASKTSDVTHQFFQM